jgi:uncharacterized protein (TIGR04551 family)
VALLLTAPVTRAAEGVKSSGDAEANSPSSTDSETPTTPTTPNGKVVRPPGTAPNGTGTAGEREELKREVLEEVRRELEKAKSDLREEVAFEEDARNYDATTLKELKQTVNLLQLHGYFRTRGDLFNHADLGRGPDPRGYTLFPISGTNPNDGAYLGTGNMRLRLNPVLRVSDFISVKSQIDLLDNVLFGGDAFLAQTALANSSPDALANRVLPGVVVGPNFIQVKRVWAEIQTPIGGLAFGRMPFHWGEGFFYNDGNCFDCDYGNTFDRLELTVGPFIGHHVTVAADMLGQGASTTNLVPNGDLETEAYGRPITLKQLAGSYRFSLQIQKQLRDVELRRKLEANEWALNYGLLLAYRTQRQLSVLNTAAQSGNNTYTTQPLDAQFGEGDLYFQARRGRLRLAAELAMFGGQIGNNPLAPGTTLEFLQGGAVARGQYFFLKQDSLAVGVDFGFASGDKTPGMGVRTFRGQTQKGSIDGLQFNCTTSANCPNHDVTNFTVNPDFRVDELMWRNLFTQMTDAYFVRGEARFKPGGRASGGAQDTGLDLFGRILYSQAIYASSTPSGRFSPLGVEIDAGAVFTTKDGFIAGLSAAFLIPLAGMDNFNNPLIQSGEKSASLGQLYRGYLGVQF